MKDTLTVVSHTHLNLIITAAQHRKLTSFLTTDQSWVSLVPQFMTHHHHWSNPLVFYLIHMSYLSTYLPTHHPSAPSAPVLQFEYYLLVSSIR